MTDTDTLTRPFQLGDRVTYTYGNTNYAGTVRGLFHTDGVGVDGSNNGHAPESVFVTNPDAANRPNYSYRPNTSDYSGHQYRWADDIPEGEQGIWASLRYERVALDPTADVERATAEQRSHQEALDTITRLQAELSEQQSLVETARNVISTIGTDLANHADRSEWCDTYESFVRQTYDNLPSRGGFDDTFRAAAERVDRDFTVTYTATRTVSARDEDSAREAFNGGYFSFYGSDVEVTDVEED